MAIVSGLLFSKSETFVGWPRAVEGKIQVLQAVLLRRYGLAIEVDDFTRKVGQESRQGLTVACRTQVESLCRAQSLGGLNEALDPCDVVLAPANRSVGVLSLLWPRGPRCPL